MNIFRRFDPDWPHPIAMAPMRVLLPMRALAPASLLLASAAAWISPGATTLCLLAGGLLWLRSRLRKRFLDHE